MRRSYKFRLRPTTKQHVLLEQCLRSHCELYNAALENRMGSWKWNRESISYGKQSSQLSEIRKLCPGQSIWSFSSQQATLRRLNKSFSNFFRRVKNHQVPGFPRFKSVDRWDTVEWPKDGDGCKWKPEYNQVYLQGVGTLKVTVHRKIEGIIKTVSVKREGRKWFLILSCDGVPQKLLPKTGAIVGIDLGINVYVATSDGELIENPKWFRTSQGKLSRAQRKLVTKKKRSNNRKKQRETVSKLHRKTSNQRRDFQFKLANHLVSDYDLIIYENLNVKGMMKSNHGTVETPGKNVAQKTGLNKSIQDAGWSSFLSILTFKAEEAGKIVRGVNPKNTSRTCFECKHISKENRDGIKFECVNCGFTEHADINAANNVLRTGLVLLNI